MRNSSEKGFTLIEVVMATVILTIGIGIFSSIVANVSRRNFYSHRHTQAVILVQNKIEEILNAGYESADLEEGEYENALNPVNSTADSSGIYSQFWDIYNSRPIPRSKQIVSFVQWEGVDGELKTVTLTAVCIDQSN